MQQRPESEEPTGYLADAAAPTELAGVASADTQAAHAWAFDPVRDLEPEPRFTPGRITAMAVGAAMVVIAAAAGVAVWSLRGDEPAPAPAARPDLLDGLYRVQYHWDQATYREVEGSTDWGAGAGGPAQDWLTLTSACTDTDCIATGEVLSADRARLPGARTLKFQLVNGTWQDIAPARVKSTCTYDDGSVAGQSWTTVTLGFTPRPDGTFTGELTTVVDTDECGDQGNTVVTPLTAGRVGEAL
ncbi:hypothetical protein L2K20_04345 [Mycobacterium sp. MBM]|nr:hypothetical protein [Mycobacterium sp. MBM]